MHFVRNVSLVNKIFSLFTITEKHIPCHINNALKYLEYFYILWECVNPTNGLSATMFDLTLVGIFVIPFPSPLTIYASDNFGLWVQLTPENLCFAALILVWTLGTCIVYVLTINVWLLKPNTRPKDCQNHNKFMSKLHLTKHYSRLVWTKQRFLTCCFEERLRQVLVTSSRHYKHAIVPFGVEHAPATFTTDF